MRRVYIVKKKKALSGKDLKAGADNNCPEIANGIPLGLRRTISESDLPCVYVEPDIIPGQTVEEKTSATFLIIEGHINKLQNDMMSLMEK